MQDPLSRVTGVGNVQVFGAQYAMRIWLDPYKLHNFALQPSDVDAAIQAQNVQVSAGQIGGQPAVPGQAAERHRHRPVAAADPGAVPQHHPEDHAGRRGGAAVAMWRASSWAPTPMPSSAA